MSGTLYERARSLALPTVRALARRYGDAETRDTVIMRVDRELKRGRVLGSIPSDDARLVNWLCGVIGRAERGKRLKRRGA